MPKVLILSGYGINCENETAYAFSSLGAETEICHINSLIKGEQKLANFQILVFPGGFSYGDHIGAGKALANKFKNNLWDDLLAFVNSDKLVIGICNGFQILVAMGILPAIGKKYGESQAMLLRNDNAKYIDRWVNLKASSKKCIWTKNIDEIYLPIAHGEGKFFVDEQNLQELKENDQIVFRYISSAENSYAEYNPNGALDDIAGVCDLSGRILGLMPHPERALRFHHHPNFSRKKEELLRAGKSIPEEGVGVQIFQNAIDYFAS